MYRYILIFILIFCSLALNAQIGINTTTPLSILHVDPKGDTSGTVSTALSGDSDDLIITTDGKIGIGTANPTSRLSVIGTGSNSGLQLTNGAKTGYTLSSDPNGNMIWMPTPVQYQTIVANSTVSNQTVSATFPAGVQVKTLGSALKDTAKDAYGSGYGWNATTQKYTVPVKGLYRITSQVYFVTTNDGINYRSYWNLNGTTTPALGVFSFIANGNPTSAYLSNIYSLNKDDVLYLEVLRQHEGTGNITYTQGIGYTFIMIEMLDQQN